MKAAFTCDKCGFTMEFDLGHIPYDGVFRNMPIPPHICKQEITYGPLTEEMVAEALAEAEGYAPSASDEFTGAARFVLRLLQWVVAYEEEARKGNPEYGPLPYFNMVYNGQARDKLMSLARMD